ncbi:hypothetical protein Bbelb_061210 [Branchiostoma belcheri]|nr:hypothetical protein Bbelb_061210 [Branchiostoma belcheri]
MFRLVSVQVCQQEWTVPQWAPVPERRRKNGSRLAAPYRAGRPCVAPAGVDSTTMGTCPRASVHPVTVNAVPPSKEPLASSFPNPRLMFPPTLRNPVRCIRPLKSPSSLDPVLKISQQPSCVSLLTSWGVLILEVSPSASCNLYINLADRRIQAVILPVLLNMPAAKDSSLNWKRFDKFYQQ